jgi:hypothetical protein
VLHVRGATIAQSLWLRHPARVLLAAGWGT